MAYWIDDSACTICKECIKSCPIDAITMGSVYPVINKDECVDCGVCADDCPEECIHEG